MKKIFLPIIAIAIVATVSTSCENATTKDSDNAVNSSSQKYTCPMHPEVISDKPGSCPKCGMDLVKKSAHEHMDMMHDSTMKNDNTMHRDSTMKM